MENKINTVMIMKYKNARTLFCENFLTEEKLDNKIREFLGNFSKIDIFHMSDNEKYDLIDSVVNEMVAEWARKMNITLIP